MSIRLSRKKINDMVDRDYSFSSRRGGGGSGAGGGGGVSSQWVDEHYVSKEFFARLFTINGTDENDDDVVVEPNDLETTITNIQMMVGAWTESYLSALGINPDGGGGGGATTLASLTDVTITSPTQGQTLVYDGNGHWVNANASGSVVGVSLTMPTGFTATSSTSGGAVSLTASFNRGSLANGLFLATPGSGDGNPDWRALAADDLPDIPWSKIGDDSKPLSWWGQNTWGADGVLKGSLSDVTSISMSSTITGCTSIDSLLYFDTNNSYIGLNTSSPAYHLDVIGQLRFRQTSSQTASCVLGCYADAGLPFVRFRDPNNTIFDICITNTGTDESPVYSLEMGRYDKFTNILGSNIRMYSKTSADANSVTLAFRAIIGGRVAVGAADSTLTGGNTDCKLVVNGNACTAESDGSFMQIGLVRLVYDSTNNALKVIKKDGTTANFYATGAVSALGSNTASGGGGVSLNTLLTSLNNTSLNPATVSNKVLVNSSGTWTWQNYTSATGTVTSVGMTVPTGFSVSPSSITSSGTFAVSFGGSVTKNYVLASPSSAAGAPSWRELVAADIPGLDAGKITSGTFDAARIPNLSASKITSGTLDAARIPDLSGTYATDARMDTVEGYFDSNGYAKTAVKLSTVSKTLWGNTYWTSGGVPTSVGVSGTPASLSYVSSISMAGDITGAGDITMGNKAQPKLIIGQDNTYYIRKASSSTLGYGVAIRAGGDGEQFAVYSTKTYTNKQLHTTVGLLSDGYVTALSDIRYKDVVAKVSPMVEDIAKASIIRYTWKFHADKTIHIGGIAQEWKVILPETVIDGGDKLSMDYGKIGAIAGIANARRIVDHETRIRQLEEIFLLKQDKK